MLGRSLRRQPSEADILAALGMSPPSKTAPTLDRPKMKFAKPRFVPTGTISAPRQSMGQAIESNTAGALRKVGLNDYDASRWAGKLFGAFNDLTPVGNLTGADDGARMVKQGITQGDLRTGLLGGATFLASVLPYGNKAKKPLQSLMRDETGAIRAWQDHLNAAKLQGFTTDAYHGTSRPDRILERGGFDPKRATSGPMPFFTDDPVIASNYATAKADTSRIAEDANNYADWFKADIGRGKPKNLQQLWWELTPEQRATAQQNLGRVTEHEEYLPNGKPNPLAGQFYLGEGPGGQGHWEYTLRQHRGNPILAAQDVWLDSGNLFNQEERFIDVMRAAGLDVPLRYDSPHLTMPGVVPVKLRMGETLNTTDDYAMRSLLAEIEGAAKGKRYKTALRRGVDMWDKTDIGLPEFRDQLRLDIAEGRNPTSFTRIPDEATNVMKRMGFESITDTGGKMGGEGHTVFIPFSPDQVRSRFAPFATHDPLSPFLLGETKRRR